MVGVGKRRGKYREQIRKITNSRDRVTLGMMYHQRLHEGFQ